MGFHTFPVERADALEDPSRYRYCSREELVAALALDGSETVADLGSGTGFYTDDVAPFAGSVYAVDVQSEMHDAYREKGVPANVQTVTAAVDDLPFGDGELDAAFSTMTHHEYASEAAFAELRRVLASGARLVTVDWSATGIGEDGPPTDERYALEDAAYALETAGFEVVAGSERPETYRLVASA
ncbi:class I SAM-dependent methyltransferase [Halorubellus sp. JP-L1]|uniref:class I SAM-dependent methyltransferase n=1 Tax=Halorubellus sp. JP-L1 TaxID=2715753 RepID=UPI0014089E42|nr:class I SAM-dependent methyltransferase [Halorubellus sp. JP-L1]NHN40910.1 class I SAM-dependent methyltransferase [Halorubellus sp. JP-L1]